MYFKKKYLGGHFIENDKFIFKTVKLPIEQVYLSLYPLDSLKLIKTKNEKHYEFKSCDPLLKETVEKLFTVEDWEHTLQHRYNIDYWGMEIVSYWEIDVIEHNIFVRSELLKEKELEENEFDLITLLENTIREINENIDDGKIKLHLIKYNSTFQNILFSLNEALENKLPLSKEAEKTLEGIFKDFSLTILDRCEVIIAEKKEIEMLEKEAKQKMYSEIISFELNFQKEHLL
jgi:hypothetical protein